MQASGKVEPVGGMCVERLVAPAVEQQGVYKDVDGGLPEFSGLLAYAGVTKRIVIL